MSKAEELLALAARVEAGEGADRELDDAIATAIYSEPERHCVQGLSDEAGGMWMFRYPNGSIGSSLRFTASLDAAMTLVPEGWAIESLSHWPAAPEGADNHTTGKSSARLVGTSLSRFGKSMIWGHGFGDGRVDGDATTPALALTAAALRALAHQEPKP